MLSDENNNFARNTLKNKFLGTLLIDNFNVACLEYFYFAICLLFSCSQLTYFQSRRGNRICDNYISIQMVHIFF